MLVANSTKVAVAKKSTGEKRNVEAQIQRLLYKDSEPADKFEVAERDAFIKSIVLLMGNDACFAPVSHSGENHQS